MKNRALHSTRQVNVAERTLIAELNGVAEVDFAGRRL